MRILSVLERLMRGVLVREAVGRLRLGLGLLSLGLGDVLLLGLGHLRGSVWTWHRLGRSVGWLWRYQL